MLIYRGGGECSLWTFTLIRTKWPILITKEWLRKLYVFWYLFTCRRTIYRGQGWTIASYGVCFTMDAQCIEYTWYRDMDNDGYSSGSTTRLHAPGLPAINGRRSYPPLRATAMTTTAQSTLGPVKYVITRMMIVMGRWMKGLETTYYYDA